MINKTLTYYKHLFLGVILMLSFGNAVGQVDLEINRSQVIIPAQGTPPQICTTETSPLQFRIDNIGNLDYTVTNASSITVTLTLSGGNTFSPSGLTTKVHSYSSAPSVKGGSPPNTLEATGGFATFDWPASKPIIFSNSIQANINIEIATGVASDTTPANNTTDYVVDIVPNPITPVLSAGPYGDGTINLCQGALVTFTVLPNTVGLRHEFDIAGVIVQNLVNVNTYATSALVTNQLINVTTYNTSNCGVTGNPIRALVHPVPVGTLISDKSNDVVCPGEDVLFTALATGAAAVSPRYEFFLDNISVQSSSTQATFSLGTASITIDGHVVRVRTWNNTGAGGLCYDDDSITLRLNTFSSTNQITNTTTSVCAGVDPDPFSSQSSFSSDLGGDIVHVWEEDINGDGNFLPITPAANGLTYDPPVLTRTTAYRRLSYPRFNTITCNSSIASATSNVVTITFNPTSVASLRSNATTSSNTLCAGDSLILNASLSSGAQSYIFYKNNQPLPPSTPQSLATYTLISGAFDDNDVIKVRAYSGTGTDSCFSEAQFVIRVNSFSGGATPVPGNTIGNSFSVCKNETPLISFTSISTPTLPNSILTDGATITYQWQSRSGTNTFMPIAFPAGRGELYTPSSVSTDTDFRRVAISTFNGKTCSLISNTVRLSVSADPVASLNGSNTSCLGEAVLFTASGGVRYEFFNGGTSLGASSTVSTISRTDLLDLNSITVEVTDGNGCSVISDPIIMNITSPPSPSISSGRSNNRACSGDYPVFTAGPPVAGYTYEFFVNNTLQTTGVSSNTFDSNLASTTVNFLNVNTIRVRVTNSGCSSQTSIPFYVDGLTGANSISATQTICEGATPNTLIGLSNPLANSAGATVSYQWEEKLIGGNFTPIFAATGPDFSPGSLTVSRVYRRLVYSNFNGTICPSSKDLAASNSVTITVDSNSAPVINFTSGLQSDVLCAGDSVTFDASGTTGASTYEFYVQNIRVRAALNSNTFTPILGSLNDNDIVRVRANSALGTSCFSEQSITIRVNAQANANTITGSQTVCFNGPVSTLNGSTVTGTPTITYQWQSRTSTDTFSDIFGAVGVNYTPSGLSSTTAFRRNVLSTLSSKTCVISSGVVTVTVSPGPPPVARLVTTSNIGCGGSTPPMASRSDFIFDASSSTNDLSYEFFVGGASQGPASSVSTISLTLTDSQTVRVDVYPLANGAGCPNSTSITVRVNSIIGDNIIGGTDLICENDDASALNSVSTPTSTTGTLTYQWQVRSGTNTFTNISPGGNGIDYDPSNLSTTTFYRRLAVSTIGGLACSVPSNVVTITVDSSPIITGVLTSDAQTICIGNTPNTQTVSFTVSAAASSIVFYINNSAVQTSTSRTYTASQSIFSEGDVVTTRLINSAGCFSEQNLIINVNNIAPGSISGSQAVCAGSTPIPFTSVSSGVINGVTVVSPGTGSYQWQTSTDTFNWIDIRFATSDTYSPAAAPPATIHYRRLTINTLNGFECKIPSNSITVSVDALPNPGLTANGGAFTAPATITSCASNTISFNGSGGTEYQFFVNNISAQSRDTSSTFLALNPSDSDEVFVRVYKTALASSCFADSGIIKVDLEAPPVASISPSVSNRVFCSGTDVLFTADSGGVASATYEFKVNNTIIQTFSTTNTFNSGDYPALTLVGNPFIEVTVRSPSGCSNIASVTLIENAISSVGTLTSSTATVCLNQIPDPIVGSTAVASGSITYGWQSSSDGILYSLIGGATSTTYTPTTGLISTTFYQRVTYSEINSVTCSSTSTPFRVSISPAPIPNLIAIPGALTAPATLTLCDNTGVGIFNASGGASYEFRDENGIVLQARSTTSTFSATTSSTLLDNSQVIVRVFSDVAGGCFEDSNSITIQVSPQPTVSLNSIGGLTTFCTGDVVTMTATSTIAGSNFRFSVNGSIQQNFSVANTFIPILNTPDAVTGNYVVLVEVNSPGGCTVTDTLTLFENVISSVGTLTTASSTICSGEVPQPIIGTSTVASGSISYQWEESFDNITYTPILGAANAATYTPTVAPLLSATRIFYKRITTSIRRGTACTVETAPVLITISSPTPSLIADPGNISATGTFTMCEGSEARFTAAGGLSYEFYVNGIKRGARSNQSTFTISSLTNSPSLRNNERVRVLVFDQLTGAGGCSAFSDEIIVRTIDVPTVNLTRSDTTGSIFCTGDEPSFTASSSLSSATYEFFIGPTPWQNSTSTVFTPIQSLYVPFLTDGDVISVVVNASGVSGCSATDSITMVENAFTVSGLITNASPMICSGGTPSVFTNVASASGTGSITYRWQSGLSTATFIDIVPFVTTATFTPTTSLTTHTLFRRRAISTIGVDECESFSNTIEIRISPPLDGGLISPALMEICTGDSPGALSVTGGSIGPLMTYEWQISSDGLIFTAITSATGQTYTPSSLNTTTFYKRIVNLNGGGPPASCTAESSIIRINIVDLNPGSLDERVEQAYCFGTMPPTLTSSITGGVQQDAFSSVGTISYQWQESLNDGTWTNIPSATQNYYNPPSLIQTTFFRRIAISTTISNVCTDFTESLRIEIIDDLDAGTILPADQNICSILTAADLPRSLVLTSPETQTTSVTYQWQQSLDKSVWFDIPGQQNLNLNFSLGLDGVAGTPDDDSWLPSSTSTSTYYRVVTTYVGNPKPFAQEQVRILLTDQPRVMAVGEYMISVNGDNHAINTTLTSTLDQIGSDLAAKITSDDPIVNAAYNSTTNIITLQPIIPGTYNVASSILLTDDTIALSFPDNPPIFMTILVSGNTGTRTPNAGLDSCQIYSSIAEISSEPQPEFILVSGIVSPQQVCRGDLIIPIQYTYTSNVDEIQIRNLDPGLIPTISGAGTVVGPFDVGGLGIAGWYRITNSASRTFSITGSVTNSSNFSMVTILDPLSQCNPITETYVIQVTPNAVQPNFIRKGQNLPGYEVLSSQMSSIASITAITPVRWYNNTVCQDRLPAPTTEWTDFYACYSDNTFNQLSNSYEWEVSPPEAGNMTNNNFQETTIQLNTLAAPALGENYTVSITTVASGTTAYTTTSTLAIQTTDEIGIDLASKISLDSAVDAIYNNVIDQIIIEAATPNLSFTTTVSPLAIGQSTQFSIPSIRQITRSGTMQWNPSFTGSSTIRVRSIGCGSNVSSWTSVVIDVIPETVPINPASDLYPPVVIDAGICSGATTGIVPLCQVDAFTLPTQFFTASDNAANVNDYGSLEWRMENIAPGSLTVATPGTIDQATGIITWNIGWWGTFDLQVRPVDCDGGFGVWSTSTISIGPTNGPVTDVTPISALPECPIPDSGFSTTLRSSQEVNWYVNSRLGLVSSTTFINTVTFQLTPLPNNDLFLDFEPGFSGNIIITAEPALCPGSTVNYVINIPDPPTIVLTSGFNSNLLIGPDSICRNTAINTITYQIEGAADAVTVTGLPTGVIPVLDITPQSTSLNLSNTGTAFSAGQIYSIQINNNTYNFVTTGPGNDIDTVGEGLRDDINLRTTNFVATYASPLLSIEPSGTGKRGDSFIIAPSTPVGNSVDIDPPLTTPLQKILTISGTPLNSVPPGQYPYIITTLAPAANCAVVSATGIIEIEESASITIVNGIANNTGANSICNGASYTPPASLLTLDIINAFNLRVDPLTPLPNGLALSLSASGTANQFEITGQISESVFVPTTFVVNLVTTGANCEDAVLQISIEVEPNPTIDPAVGANLDPFVCSSEPLVPIRFEVFNPAFGLGETVSSTFPPGVDGRLYQQIQVSQFTVDFLLGAGDTTAVSDTFVFNINNIPYTYATPNTSTNIQLAAEINTFLTAQLPATQFTVLYTAGTNVIQIQHVNAGIAFNVISSDSATFLDISETQIITPPSYYEISGTPSVTLGAPTPYVYELTTSGPNCTGSTSVSGTITVQPSTSASYLSGVLNQVICDNETMTDIVYSTVGAVAIAIVTPTTPSWIDVDFDPITQQITISTPAAPNQNVTTTTVYNYQINLQGSLFGCNTVPSPISGTVTISPLDQISHIITSGAENQSICVGGNPAIPFAIDPIEYQLSGGATGATVTGLPPGITPTFTALNRLILSGTATAIPSPTFTYNYQIITTPAGCVSATASGSITVFSQPELTLVTTATTANQVGANAICDAQPIETIIYEHSTTTPVTTQVNFTWVGSNTLFGFGVTALSSGTNQFVISGTPTTNVTETTVYNYQIETVGSNCEPEVVLTGSIQINPNQTIDLISPVNSDNQTVCINDQDNPATANTSSFVSIEYQLVGGATNYNIIGLPPGLTHNRTISNTVLIDGFIDSSATTIASPTVIYNYIITTTGTCSDTQALGVIEVHSLPTLSLTSSVTSADQTGINAICDGTPMETIIYEMGGGATLMDFTWVGSNTLSFAGSGFVQTNTGTQIILSGTPTTNVTQTTYYNYQVETLGSNCIPEIVLTGSIQINPNQTITLVSSPTSDNQVVCVRDNNNPLEPETSNFVPIVYELGGGATGAIVTGLPDGISPSTTATAIIINGQPSSLATSLVSPTIIYNYTVTTFGGCTTSTINGSIEVQSLPTLTLVSTATTANQTGFGGAVCVNQDIVPIIYEYGGGAEGITFNWTSPANVAPVTSLSQVYSGTQFIISGRPSPSATLTTTTIFEYEIVTRDSNCLPEITLTGRIEVKPEDALELISGVGSDFPTVCVGGLPTSESLTDIVYELKNGAESAIVTGLPPGISYTVTTSKTIVISGTAQASASLSSTTLTPWIYTVTTIGCSPVVANGTITVTPKPELILIAGTAVQTPVCNLTPIIDAQYIYNPAAGGPPVVTWPNGQPNGVNVSSGGFTDRLTIGGIPSVVITRTTIYPYEVTFSGTCSPSVVLRGSIGVIPTPVIDSNYILTNDVTNVSCFDASDGSIIIPDEASLGFSNRITGGMLSIQQIDEISISGTTTIGDIIRVTAAGNTFEYIVKADPYGSAIPESLAVVNNLVAKVINDGVVTSGPVIEPYVSATPIAGGISLQADIGGIPLNTSVDITQTTSLSSAITTIQENRALNYNFSWQGPDGYTSSSLSIFNLKAGDYVLTVDLNGCSDQSEVITITEPAELKVGVNLCSGSAQVSVTGGTPPYTFILEDDNGAQIGAPIVKPGEHTYTGLAIGDDYIVEVTDQSCTVAVREAFRVPTSLSFNHWDLNEGVTNSYCATGTIGNGSIELTRGTGATFQSAFSGGSNVFSYKWQSSSSSGTIGVSPNIYNLPPDVYTVTVTDLILGCSDTRSFTVGGFPVLELNAVVVGFLIDNSTGVASSTADYVYNLACNGDTDANFTLIASGGNSNYTITPVVPVVSTISNIGGTILVDDGGPGLYTFNLQDTGPNGDICSVIKTVEVINPDPMFLVENTGNRNNPICNGDFGLVEFNVVGGSPNRGPYRVTLNGGALVKSSLTPGDRRVVFDNIDTSLISSIATNVLIEDAFGCSVTTQLSSQIVFNVIPDLQFESDVIDIDCSVPTDGSVTFREVGPDTFADSQQVQIRVYLASNGTNIFKAWGANPNESVSIPLTGLGIYNYNITDGNGCLLTPTPDPTFEVKVIGNDNPLNIGWDVTPVGCGNDTSRIVLNIENIVPPLSISWFEKKPVVTTISSTTGGITTSTDTTNIEFVLIPSLDGNATVSDLPEGVYRAEVSDARSQNCGGTVATVPPIILQESSIEVVNFKTIENEPALCDNYGNAFTSDVSFRINANLNRGSISSNFNISLLSQNTGAVIPIPAAMDINGDGIVDPKPRGYTYRYPLLPADSYTLTIEERLPPTLPATSTLVACSEIYFFEILDYLPIEYTGDTVGITTDLCTGLGTIIGDAVGGVPFTDTGLPTYSWLWTFTPQDTSRGVETFNSKDILNAEPGSYCVKITDSNGCTYDSCDTAAGATPIDIEIEDKVTPFSITGNLTDPDDSSLKVKSLPPDCTSGGLNGQIGIAIDGGQLPIEITWFIEDPTTLTAATNPGYRPLSQFTGKANLRDLVPGNYKMILQSKSRLADACKGSGNFLNNDYLYYEEIIQVTPNRELYVLDGPFVDDDLCGSTQGRLEIDIYDNNDGNLDFYYNDILISPSDVIQLSDRSWSVGITNAVETAPLKIKNAEGCWIEVEISRGIGEPSFTYDSPALANSGVIGAREEVTFENTSTDPFVKSEWIFGDSTIPVIVESSTVSITPVRHVYGVSGTYFATLRIYNSIGCSEEETMPIVIGKGYNIRAPNVFTPGGTDTINSHFRPLFNGFSNMIFTVYDYRGNILYSDYQEETDVNNPVGFVLEGWDGSNDNNSPYYIYTASGLLLDEETRVEKSGTFIIIR